MTRETGQVKTILVQVESGPAAEGRLQCALDIARASGAHLVCPQITPLDGFVSADPLGGIYAMPLVMAAIADAEEELRVSLEARLGGEDVSWDFRHVTGYPPVVIASQARLADLVVLGKPAAGRAGHDAMVLLGQVILGISAPVLAVPDGATGFDAFAPAVIGWNGSTEAANAVRAALPLLAHAASISVFSVEEQEDHDLPETDICEYLSRHGLHATMESLPRGEPNVADALLRMLAHANPGYFVMGAYGYSRASEYLFGGVTRRMLSELPVPLVLAH